MTSYTGSALCFDLVRKKPTGIKGGSGGFPAQCGGIH